MTTPRPMPDDPADRALEVFLTTADAELLDHVHAHINPTRALNALFDLTQDTAPEPPRGHRPPPHAVAASVRHIRARIHTLHVGIALNRVIEGIDRADEGYLHLNPDLARDLDHAVDQALDVPFRDLGLDLVTGLVRAFDRARDLARDLARARDLDVEFGLEFGLGLDRARELVLDLDRLLYGDTVGTLDVSGADLSDLELTHENLRALADVVWDENTRWPRALRQRITSSSEEIAEGVYRVRSGNEHDRVHDH
ncbi:hypothetical protein [Thermomonospora umbrina]|uniref:Uncharacterized protein n=1 Tax=Thermomonospora umbrina TaxID=111806 RepID=A0A3D9SY16_9ACTN|nr:hypothetical protein [Thermomonospora umbrina]REF00458.1 hypothetical protein DFJ69_5996 [Thermomonospora umbrina]